MWKQTDEIFIRHQKKLLDAETMEAIDGARKEYRNGKGVTCKTVADSMALFEKL